MLRTALFDTHKRLGARLIDFGGWEMPVMYRGIQDEHVHTRTASSVFDVSHMGRLVFRGKDAENLLQWVCTRNLAKLKVGRCGYAHVCNERGGILDDVIVSRCADHFAMVCNASNREKIVAHLKKHAQGRQVTIEDLTQQTAMLAIQGPATMELFGRFMPIKLPEIARYGFVDGSYMGTAYTIARTGYTGEDGLEVTLPAAMGPMAWDYLTADGGTARASVKPAGLGARDTLRLEAGMPLYGHELNEDIDPISAGCKWCVGLDKDFLGADVLRKIDQEGPRKKLAGLVLDGKRIARQGYKVLSGGREVGEVTSGTLSPTLEKSIAMAYIETDKLGGGDFAIDLRGSQANCQVVPLPFYKRSE